MPWDELSRIYDRQLALERPALRVALGLAQIGAEDVVLDAGTGTGAVLRELALRPERPRRALGVDSSRAMLARVPALPAGWSVELAGLDRLPLADASVDVAVASYVLNVLAPAVRAAALAELHRVLRPGGRVVTVTPALPRGAATRPLWLALTTLARRSPRRFCGLLPLDPRSDLLAASFRLERARTVRLGYPSLCVAANRPPGPGTPVLTPTAADVDDHPPPPHAQA